MTRQLALGASAFLLVLILTHIAEALRILPAMGWGLPHSPGHYLNLFSAASGIALLMWLASCGDGEQERRRRGH